MAMILFICSNICPTIVIINVMFLKHWLANILNIATGKCVATILYFCVFSLSAIALKYKTTVCATVHRRTAERIQAAISYQLSTVQYSTVHYSTVQYSI